MDDADNSAKPEVSPLWVPRPPTHPLHGTVVTTVLCLTQAGGTRSSIKLLWDVTVHERRLHSRSGQAMCQDAMKVLCVVAAIC